MDWVSLFRRWRRAAERVTGAKYPSICSDASDGVGDGDITRGVAGTRGEDISTASGRRSGRAGKAMTPLAVRCKSRDGEWR